MISTSQLLQLVSLFNRGLPTSRAARLVSPPIKRHTALRYRRLWTKHPNALATRYAESPPSQPVGRCPTCFHRVTLPCLRCRLLSLAKRRALPLPLPPRANSPRDRWSRPKFRALVRRLASARAPRAAYAFRHLIPSPYRTPLIHIETIAENGLPFDSLTSAHHPDNSYLIQSSSGRPS